MSVSLSSGVQTPRSSTPSASVSGIVHDEHTKTRTIPQSVRPDGSLRKERKVKPGYVPQEDIARFRSRRLIQEDARRAAEQGASQGEGAGKPPVSVNWKAATAAPSTAASSESNSPVVGSSSGTSSSKYSSQFVALQKSPGKGWRQTFPSTSKTDIQQIANCDPVPPISTTDVASETRSRPPSSSTSSSMSHPKSASPSSSKRREPGSLFARAMGSVVTQDQPTEAKTAPEIFKVAGHKNRIIRTADARRGDEIVVQDGQARTWRDVAAKASSSSSSKVDGGTSGSESARLWRPTSDAPSWRKGTPSALPPANTTSAKVQTTRDEVDEVTAGLESLQVARKAETVGAEAGGKTRR